MAQHSPTCFALPRANLGLKRKLTATQDSEDPAQSTRLQWVTQIPEAATRGPRVVSAPAVPQCSGGGFPCVSSRVSSQAEPVQSNWCAAGTTAHDLHGSELPEPGGWKAEAELETGAALLTKAPRGSWLVATPFQCLCCHIASPRLLSSFRFLFLRHTSH